MDGGVYDWIGDRRAGHGDLARGRLCARSREQARIGRLSDGIGHVEEGVLEAEALGQMLSQGLDAKRLGGVVAGGDDVQGELAGDGHDALGGFAGEERLGAGIGGLGHVVGAAAADDPEAGDGVGAGALDERGLAGDRGDLLGELRKRQPPVGQRGDETDGATAVRGEGLQLVASAEGLGEQGVVAELWVGVERQVVGGEGEVGVEEQLQPALQGGVDGGEAGPPEEAVMHEEQTGAAGGGELEELGVGGDAGVDALDLLGAGDLQAVGAVVLEGIGFEEGAGGSEDLGCGGGHGATITGAGDQRFRREPRLPKGLTAMERGNVNWLRLVALTLASAAVLCGALCASPALAAEGVTTPPELLSPQAAHAYGSPLPVEYVLPEAASPGAALVFTPEGGGAPTNRTLTEAERTAGTHSFPLDLHELVPDGKYVVSLSYQNLAKDPIASASVEKVTIKTVTTPPTLTSPVASASYKAPLSIEYTLPEAARTSSVELEFSGSGSVLTVLTLTASASTAGTHHFFLNPHDPGSDTTDVLEVGPGETIPDGEYTVTLRYGDQAGDPVASASASGVKLKTVTGPPVLTAPLAGQAFFEPFAATYSLPEAALTNSVRLVFTSVHGGGTKELTLTNTEAGEHTVEVAPSNPASKPGIASGPPELPADEYLLSLSYQDALGNTAASSTPIAVRITNGPPCALGTYSATGEAPCSEAPAGYYVSEIGATSAMECPAGRYTPEKGMTLCLPADPGHYVPGKAASAELECEAGSFASVAESTGCTPTPENTYSARGAFEPTPCPAGTGSGVGASSCSAVETPGDGSGGSGSAGSTGAGSKPAGPGAANPPSLVSPIGSAAARVTVKIAAGKHGASLARTRHQRYVLRCSATTTVLVRVNARVRAGRRHVSVAGRKRMVACRAGKPVEGVVSFGLTRVAKQLLKQHGASVRLTVLVYATGAAGRGRLASATVRGRR
jgi:hypothetical protein